MQLVYSALTNAHTKPYQQNNQQQNDNESELMLRYHAYQSTCNKYSHEIAAIQKYMPGWMPKFR